MKKIFKSKPYNYNAGSQAKYAKKLKKLVKTMVKDTKLNLFSKFNSLRFEVDFVGAYQKVVNVLQDKYDAMFSEKGRKYAEDMLKTQYKLSVNRTNENLKDVAYVPVIDGNVISAETKQIFESVIEQNVSLISSLPQEYYKNITGDVMRSLSAGGDLPTLIKDLQKYEGITKRRAEFIATDQVRKAYTASNIINMKEVGSDEFEWLHSGGGQHPRKSHEMLDGKILSLDLKTLLDQQKELGVPEKDRGFPAYPPNCGCTMLVVLKTLNKDKTKP